VGLDVTHDCWHGAYSAFNRFREEVWDLAYPNHKGKWSDDAFMEREWREFTRYKPATEPLDYLLFHSDCEDDLKRYMLIPLAERLEAIAPFLSTEGVGHMAHGAQAKALQFAKGLREAHAAKETVEFK